MRTNGNYLNVMDSVETRGGVRLETRDRGRAAAGIAAAACAILIGGLVAGAWIASLLFDGCVARGRGPRGAGADRAALERNIRAGVYPDADWDKGEG